MKLEVKDRMILINQYEILRLLDPENESDYLERIEILQSGYEVFFDDDMSWETFPSKKSDIVFSILDLYRVIEAFKRDNSKSSIHNHEYGYFRGFDGNLESQYFGFAKFLIETQGKYEEQLAYKTDGFNSHCPMLETYTNMITAWKNMNRKSPLNEEQILSILNTSNQQHHAKVVN